MPILPGLGAAEPSNQPDQRSADGSAILVDNCDGDSAFRSWRIEGFLDIDLGRLNLTDFSSRLAAVSQFRQLVLLGRRHAHFPA